MILTRVIPCLDIKDGRVVKGVNFVGLVDSGDPVELGMAYSDSGADELVFLDITATSDSRAPVIELAKRVAENVFIPFTVGGGLRAVEDVSKALKAGADKVSLNSAAVKNSNLVRQCSEAFGAQCITVAIDAKRFGDSWHVFTAGGRHDEGMDAVEWAEQVQSLGAGEILLTSMDRDGTRQGCDNELNLAVSKRLSIPVIASGGVGSAEDAADAILIGHADAVLIAGILHNNSTTVEQIKRGMAGYGVKVRLSVERPL